MVTTAAALRLAFFGTPDFAVPSLRAVIESRHEVVALVSQPDRPKGRGHKLQPTPTKQVAADAGLHVLQPARIKDEEFLAAFRDLRVDLGIVAAYGKILPDALLAIPPMGMINVHASLLPAYRGAAPVHRAVIDGRLETGVTIMRVVRELDAGPMLAKARRPIGHDETSVDVEKGLANIGAGLLLEVVEQMAAGLAREEPQDDAQATYAGKIVREEGLISWTLPAAAIHNRVRGLQPWPLVSVRLEGQRYLLHRTNAGGGDPDAAAPGTIVDAAGDRLVVATGEGLLQILQLQPEGRRVLTSREFLAGYRIRPGMQFEP
jgi:methionyl-tRNA formyltransferase